MHTHTLWAAQVAAGTVLPDKRLQARLACLLETFAERPNDAIPQAAGSWGQAKGIYRFLANPRVQPDALQQGVSSDTAPACLGPAYRAGGPGHHLAQSHGVPRAAGIGADWVRQFSSRCAAP